jgi:hypothetical protein
VEKAWNDRVIHAYHPHINSGFLRCLVCWNVNEMSWIRENKLKSLVISIELAVIFWALWSNAETVVEEIAMIFHTTPEIVNWFLIIQGVLILILLGYSWKILKK